MRLNKSCFLALGKLRDSQFAEEIKRLFQDVEITDNKRASQKEINRAKAKKRIA